MSALFSNKIYAVIGVLVIVIAGILAVTKFKIPAKNVNLSSNSANNTNALIDPCKTPRPMPTTNEYPFSGQISEADIKDKQARISSDKGEIVFTLNADHAPLTVSSFVYLAKKNFFNGLTWHRVEPGFVIQGGDPLGNGTGGPGYKFADEPVCGEYTAGTVAMANSGPDTNGSQFFIMLEDNLTLPKNYTIFGQVTAGLDVVRQIAVGDKMATVTIETAP